MKKSEVKAGQYGSVKTVAKIYDCHPATVWRMVERGQIPKPVKIGHLTRWDLEQLGVMQKT